MLLTRVAEEISCRAQFSSNSTAENDDLPMMCQIRSAFFLFQKKQSWRRRCRSDHRNTSSLAAIDSINHADRQHHEKLSQPLIQSWCQKSKQPCHQLASARPLSYRRLQQYSPAHIAAAPSRLPSSFVKQARRYQDDQKVSYMIHDSFCCGKEQPVRSSNNFSAVEAGAIQIGPSSPRKAGDQQIGPSSPRKAGDQQIGPGYT
eukprot:scaffold3989_cov142-Skeletonema_marinoi.AAC.3